MLNGLDLFSGIGGIAKALEPWVRPVAYCELERYAQAVLLSRMAEGQISIAPIWDDVRTLKGEMLPGIDIITGGFPCQDVSLAGARKGLDGERTGLFREAIRLVRECRPQFVFLENVPGIRRYVPSVRGELEAIGYSCRDGFLSAASVGANHIRNRWWLLANAKCERGRPTEISELRSKNPTEFRDDGKKEPLDNSDQKRSCNAQTECELEGQQGGSANEGWWTTEPDVGRVVNGLSNRVDRIKCLGNAVVPLQAREAFKILMGIK